MNNKMKVEEQILNILNSPLSIRWKKEQLVKVVYKTVNGLIDALEDTEFKDSSYTDEMKETIQKYTKQL